MNKIALAYMTSLIILFPRFFFLKLIFETFITSLTNQELGSGPPPLENERTGKGNDYLFHNGANEFRVEDLYTLRQAAGIEVRRKGL